MYVNEKLANYDISGLLAAMRALNEEAHQNGVAGMSEDEIEAEIKAARSERKKRK